MLSRCAELLLAFCYQAQPVHPDIRAGGFLHAVVDVCHAPAVVDQVQPTAPRPRCSPADAATNSRISRRLAWQSLTLPIVKFLESGPSHVGAARFSDPIQFTRVVRQRSPRANQVETALPTREAARSGAIPSPSGAPVGRNACPRTSAEPRRRGSTEREYSILRSACRLRFCLDRMWPPREGQGALVCVCDGWF